jgi:hypothetical protein
MDKEEIAKTGILATGIVIDVNHIDQIGKYVITLMISGMDNLLKVAMPKGKMPDVKKYELGKLVSMKIVVNVWKGNSYFNEVEA